MSIKQDSPITLYRAYDPTGALLHVGLTTNLLACIDEHAANTPWWAAVASMKIEHYADQLVAEAAEVQAIATEKPRYPQRNPTV
jgi:hypothetical protein